MGDETSAQAALSRLERALDRIEAASARLQQRGDGDADARLRKLQGEVEVALGGLDRLLGSAEAS